MKRRDLAKTLLVAGAAVTVARTAQAQAPAPVPTGNTRLAEVLRRGTIRIGTTGDFNPMSFRNPARTSMSASTSRR